jgi:hypothetical protein
MLTWSIHIFKSFSAIFGKNKTKLWDMFQNYFEAILRKTNKIETFLELNFETLFKLIFKYILNYFENLNPFLK